MVTNGKTDNYWMRRALRFARFARSVEEVPIGALVVKDGTYVAGGCNLSITTSDPTAHAEVIALRRAAIRLQNYRLPGCTLYVTLEPCMMCVGAMIHARIDRLVYAAQEPKAGVVTSRAALLELDFLNHRVESTSMVLEAESRALLQHFFAQKRKRRKLEKRCDGNG